MTTFSLDAQIAEVEREIDLRIKVYKRQIEIGKMRKTVAEYHIDCMRAVLATLHKVKDGR